MTAGPILALHGVGKAYRLRAGPVAKLLGRDKVLDAVAGVDLDIAEGEILGVVGESGSGKSTLGRIMVRLLEPTTGQVLYRGQAIGRKDIPAYRRRVQMVFQDSHSALNPRKRIGRVLREAVAAAGTPAPQIEPEVARLLHLVGLQPFILQRHPHTLSGGQRQRVGIARALAMRPEILVADEPVSALDVSLQGQVINVLTSLVRTMGLTLVLISHDLAVVRRICDRIAVMRAGRIVEIGAPSVLLDKPAHAYTRALIDAVPQGLKGRHRHN